MTYDDPKQLHPYMTECAAEAARVARGVTAAQLGEPTHCTDWDVRALVNHWVLYTSHGLEHRALRRQLPEELTARDFTADPDWPTAYAAQLERAVAAWADPAVWEGEVDLGMAKVPALDIASMVIKEMAVHGWDVATATGQPFHVSGGRRPLRPARRREARRPLPAVRRLRRPGARAGRRARVRPRARRQRTGPEIGSLKQSPNGPGCCAIASLVSTP